MRPDWSRDSSGLADAIQCTELFRVRHGLGLAFDDGLGAAKGTALHAADEAWFADPASRPDVALAALRAAWTATGEVPGVTPVQHTLGFLTSLYEDYMDWWPRERDPFTVLANEAYIEAEIAPGVPYCGIRDRVILHEDGCRYVMDTKGTGSYLNDRFFHGFTLSWQQRGYVALQEAIGEPVDGVFINAFCWRKDVGKHDRFVRKKYVFADWQLREWRDDALHWFETIQQLGATRGIETRWPQTGVVNGLCHQYYGAPCPLWDVCQMDAASATAEARQRFPYRPWNPKAKVEK